MNFALKSTMNRIYPANKTLFDDPLRSSQGSNDTAGPPMTPMMLDLLKVYDNFKPFHEGASKFDRAEIESENLSAFAKVIVEHEYKDFGNGFRKPVFPDDFFLYFFGIWLFVTLPSSIAFNIKWGYRRSRKLEYNKEERVWMAKNKVGSSKVRMGERNRDRKAKTRLLRRILTPPPPSNAVAAADGRGEGRLCEEGSLGGEGIREGENGRKLMYSWNRSI